MMFKILFLVQIATGNASLESIQGARNSPRGLNLFDANGGEETSHIGTEDGLELKREIVGRSLRRASSMTYKAVLKNHLWGRVTVYIGLITYLLYIPFLILPKIPSIKQKILTSSWVTIFMIFNQTVRTVYHISAFMVDIFALIHGTTLFRVTSAIHMITNVTAAITNYVVLVYGELAKNKDHKNPTERSFFESAFMAVNVYYYTEIISLVSDFIHSIITMVVPIVFLWRGKK